jgi:predicted nucleic acid-binding protein
MIAVVDASAAVELALHRPRAAAVARALADAEWVLAPALFAAEVTNAMWKYHRFSRLPSGVCQTAIADALALPDRYAEDGDLARETFALAAQVRKSAYDTFYLVLARRHDGVLVTLDSGLRRTAGSLAVRTAPHG